MSPLRRLAPWLLLAATAVAVTVPLVQDYLFEREARRIVAVRFPAGEVVVDVAVTRSEREEGLAGRESLPPNAGMLFAYRDTRPRRFTTQDMSFALDIITLAADGVVTGVQSRGPGEMPFDTAPARYVLEVGRGWAAAHGVTEGVRGTLVRSGEGGGS